ncbi:MAG: hypothetical protein QXQ29_04795, partial [Candidatus Bathyarchaeia archaeon]
KGVYAVRFIGMFDRRCQAGVIGGLVIAMLVFSVILPLILYYQRMTEYSSKQAEIGVEYLEKRVREELKIRGLSLDEVSPSPNYPVIEVVNVGAIPVILKRIWLVEDSKVDKLIDITGVNPQVILYLNGEIQTGSVAPTLQPGYTARIGLKTISLDKAKRYKFYIESDRGVLHPREAQPLVPGKPEGNIPSDLSQILGPTFLDFFSFRWYIYEGNRLTPWPDGYEEFTIPAGSKVAFGVFVCNKDPNKRSITLDEYTHMWMYYSGAGGELKKSEFYIVNIVDGKVTPYTPITIDYDQIAFLVFAAEEPGGTKGVNIPSAKGVGYTNLLIHGTVGDLPFSQNIPFVGITFE